MSLALTILLFDWRRFLPAVLSVAFAGVLMLVQLGLLKGMFGTVTVLVDSMAADLWVTAPATESFDQETTIPASFAALLRTDAQVLGSATLSVEDAAWRSESGARVAVTLVGISPQAEALNCPEPLRAQLCAMLALPGSVVVDHSEMGRLATGRGQTAEINGHRVRVAALSTGMRSIGSSYVFTSEQTLRSLLDGSAQADGLTQFVLAQLGATTRVDKTRSRLQRLLQRPLARIWTRQQLSRQSQAWWLRESGVGAGFVFSTALGLLIAVLITSQSLRSVILSQLREYAAFRAIGVPAKRLASVVIEQALWIGVAGALLTGLLVVLIALLAQQLQIPFRLSAGGAAVATLTGLLSAVSSGLLALRELYRVQAAELLR